MSGTNKIVSQDVKPVDQRDTDFRSFEAAPIRGLAADAGGGKDAAVTFETSDPVNDHAWTITPSTPDTPAGVTSDSTPV